MILFLSIFLVSIAVASQGNNTGNNNTTTINNTQSNTTTSSVNDTTSDTSSNETGSYTNSTPRGRVREVTQTMARNIVKEANRLRIQARNASLCPERCTCSGSTIKCETSGGREMTIYAGNSGNVIVQVMGVNASTNVTLYRHNNTLYGVFRGNQTREVMFTPDQVRDKVRQELRVRNVLNNMELDEDGNYAIEAEKKSRLFWIFPVRERVRAEVSSEDGEIVRVRNPWWGWMARDVDE